MTASKSHHSTTNIFLTIDLLGAQAIAFETEAYALLDTMKYITPDVYTLVIGEARGNAAMLVASGKKGNRFILPLSRMMTAPPRMNRSFGSTVDMMIRAQELEFHTGVSIPAAITLITSPRSSDETQEDDLLTL